MQFQYNSDYPGWNGGISTDSTTMMMMMDDTEMTNNYNNNNNVTNANTTNTNPQHRGITNVEAKEPWEFPAVQPIPCARITTRIFHPQRNQVATVPNVLVRTVLRMPTRHRRGTATSNTRRRSQQPRNPQQQQSILREEADARSMESVDSNGSSSNNSSSSSSSGFMSSTTSDTEENDEEDERMNTGDEAERGDHHRNHTNHIQNNSSYQSLPHQTSQPSLPTPNLAHEQEDRAYWLQRTVREAIYGRVVMAVVLRKRKPDPLYNADWEVTEQRCAVKEMAWQHIRKERDRLAEDPIKEVAAMQYLKLWRSLTRSAAATATTVTTTTTTTTNAGNTTTTPFIDSVAASFQSILETNIMMPLDLLSDDRYLYSVMPYCDGGELFERLDTNDRFSENEARYWMKQILNGVENLQHAGICHRDLSLENLLVHESGALIIDLGMCLRIPLIPPQDLSQSLQSMSLVNATIPATNVPVMYGPSGFPSSPSSNSVSSNYYHYNPSYPQNYNAFQQNLGGNSSNSELTAHVVLSARKEQRYLIRPQGTCGKWIYMSPEIYKSREPFDGYAVDMWAAGVILFLMLTGFPPWERPCFTDDRFKYMTAGYLVQMLTEWQLGLSPDAMDLLQRMLFLDPKDRLSLDQVRAHPWMLAGGSDTLDMLQ